MIEFGLQTVEGLTFHAFLVVERGETVDRIFDLAIDMEMEDGVIWDYVPGDNSVIAFTQFGIENLQELIEMKRRQTR